MNPTNTWLPVLNRCTSPIARLVCIPYSGGDIHAYGAWAAAMPPGVELRAAQLPGRGTRFSEALPTDVQGVAASIARALESLDPLPLVLFGHSLGAAVCYETVRCLEAEGPHDHLKHVFFSGCKSPAHHGSKPVVEGSLSDEQIRERLRNYQGTPLELLDNKDLFELFLPVLRSDFRMMATYRPTEAAAVHAPVTVFAGIKEPITEAQLDAWASYAGRYFSRFRFNGGHFFIHSERTRVIRRIFQEVEVTTGFRRWRTEALAV